MGKGTKTHRDQVMCTEFHRVTSNIFPPDCLLNKLIKGNLIKELRKCVCSFCMDF